MTKTSNYQLNQWEAADPVRREDFNADNAKLDAALAKKADAAALTALQNSMTAGLNGVNTELDGVNSDLAALEQTVNADLAALEQTVNSDLSALEQAMSADLTALENSTNTKLTALESSVNADLTALSDRVGSSGHTARLIMGSYVGTGASGPSNPTTITFDCVPVAVCVYDPDKEFHFAFLRPNTAVFTSGLCPTVLWDEHTLRYYYQNITPEDTQAADAQLNTRDVTYTWFALCHEG